MHNRKKYELPHTPQVNPAYESDEHIPTATSEPNIAASVSSDLADIVENSSEIVDGGIRLEVDDKSKIRKTTSAVDQAHQLEGIKEEDGPDERNKVRNTERAKKYSDKTAFYGGGDVDKGNDGVNRNVSYENMSLSNFKNINNPSNHGSNADMGRKTSAHPEVHTGRNFRKTSTFVILPHTSSNMYIGDDPESGGGGDGDDHRGRPQDCYMSCDCGPDKLDIKVLSDSSIPELFIEFDALQHNEETGSLCWIEKARWLKYEEDYSVDLKRFDNPHLSPMSMSGLKDFRELFAKGSVKLDCHSNEYGDLLKEIIDSLIHTTGDKFSENEIYDIRNAITQRHYHAGEHFAHAVGDENLDYKFDPNTQKFYKVEHSSFANLAGTNWMSRKRSRANLDTSHGSQVTMARKTTRARLDERLEPGTEALSVQVGALKSLTKFHSWFVRLDPTIMAEGINEVNCPLRFVYILLGPKKMEDKLLEVGRCFSILMSNEKFREVAYAAEEPKEIVDAVKVFLEHSVLIPLPKVITPEAVSSMIPQLKSYSHYFAAQDHKKICEKFLQEMEDQQKEVTMVSSQSNKGVRRISVSAKNLSKAHIHEDQHAVLPKLSLAEKVPQRNCLERYGLICPPFKQLYYDLQGLKDRYASDFKDAFIKENVSVVFIGIFFIYFVVLSPAITFGALMSLDVSPKVSVTICLISSGTFQFIYSLFNGNPLEIVGITGPLFVVEKVVSALAKSFQIDLGIMRFWIGIYVAIMGFVFIASNAVIVIKHFRRSVEEVFNFFVGFIFILNALFGMFKKLQYSITDANGLNYTAENFNKIIAERQKFASGGATLFLAFIMVNFCLILVKIKRGSLFRRQIRNLLGSFNVPLGIILVVALERIFFFAHQLPTLSVPPSDKIDLTLWINLPDYSKLGQLSSSGHGFCFLIAFSVFFIMFTEVSTNSISVVKADRKLVKPGLFTLNYLMVMVIFPVISAVTGWPYVSGAMVRSNAHCIAMGKWSVNNLPGVPPKVIGAAEQRISGLVVAVMVFLSVFLGSALRYIPMAAMYGMFLYMGVMGIKDMVVTKRLISLMHRRKHWDQADFLKDYPTFNILILVLVQLFFIGILIVLNIISDFTTYQWTALIFPGFVGMYAFVRGYILPRWPKLNTHLSKMDKKHPVRLFEGTARELERKNKEQVVVTIDNNAGVGMEVVKAEEMDINSDTESDEVHAEIW